MVGRRGRSGWYADCSRRTPSLGRLAYGTESSVARSLQQHVQGKGTKIQERQADRVAQRMRANGRFAAAGAPTAARYTTLEARTVARSTGGPPEPFTTWCRGWCQGCSRARLSGDLLIAIIVAAVTATVSVPVWEWLLGLP